MNNRQLTSWRQRWRVLLKPLLVTAILFPSIALVAGIPKIRLEEVIVIAAWGWLFLGHLATGHPIRLRRCPAYKWFGLFGFSILVSIVYASFFINQSFIFRDLWEPAKVLLYFFIFTLVANLIISPANLKYYYKFALVVFMLSALVAFLQNINFAGINQVISSYYAPTQTENGLLSGDRVIGTTANPNEFGALMVLAASLALSGGLFFQKKGLRILCWGSFLVFGIALILSQSRSSLIALAFAGVMILFLFIRQKNLKRKFERLISFLLLGCVSGYFILQRMIFSKTYSRFNELNNVNESSSWILRVVKWKLTTAVWMKSIWLGNGPGKGNIELVGYVDNEWLLLLVRYGIVGMVFFLCLFGSLFFGLYHIRRVNPEPSVIALTIALQGTFVGYMFFMIPAGVYHSLQLMPILLLFLGLAYSQWQPKKTMVHEVPKP